MSESILPVPPLGAATSPTIARLSPSTGESGSVVSWSDLVTRQNTLAGPAGARTGALDPAHMGERILQAVEGMRQDYRRMVGDAHRVLQPGPANTEMVPSKENVISHEVATARDADPHATAIDEIREMLSIQLDMGRLMVHEQLVSSTAGRGNRSLDTLLRGQ
ncbi:MAG: hypothetical protein R3C97_08480 [Geminicoccaceae bacterium]